MDPLPPIPTPMKQRWREFRIQVLPVIVFILIVTVVVFLWRNYVQPISIVGTVETVQANVASLEDGMITSLSVERFQTVQAGQVIGEVSGTNPELLKATLASIRGDLMVLRSRMMIADNRRMYDHEGLRMSLMEHKIDLAKARAQLVQASNEFTRVSLLLKEDNVTSESEYDRAKADMDSLMVDVAERTVLVNALTESLEELARTSDVTIDDPITEAIETQEKALSLELQPTPLIAPMDGVVSVVFRRSGERVVAGEPIVTISSTQSDKIVAYIRQPVGVVPELNSKVMVRTRGDRRLEAEGQVLQVGAQIEAIAPGLMSPDPGKMEFGLPFLIGVPAELRDELHPGEVVDVSMMNGS